MLLGIGKLNATPDTGAKSGNLLKLTNKNYEVAFTASNGALAYILDKTTGQKVGLGNKDNTIWELLTDFGETISGCDAKTKFSYHLESGSHRLTLNYQETDPR